MATGFDFLNVFIVLGLVCAFVCLFKVILYVISPLMDVGCQECAVG